jgi:Pyruvate/2-oxoacid:ferredoxin oxidoreductase delta subunit
MEHGESGKPFAQINAALCTGCLLCASLCARGAIESEANQ